MTLSFAAGSQPAGPSGAGKEPGSWLPAALERTGDPAWYLQVDGFLPALEHEIETRLAMANGAVGTRGSLDAPAAASSAGTLVAGLFDMTEHEPRMPALVSAPDWSRLGLSVNEQAATVDEPGTARLTRTLDFRRGVLITDWRVDNGAGHTARLRTLRLLSLADRSLALHIVWLEVGGDTRAVLHVWPDASSTSLIVESRSAAVGVWRTRHTGRRLAVANLVAVGHKNGTAHWLPPLEDHTYTLSATTSRPAMLAHAVAITPGEAGQDPATSALECLGRARRRGPERLLAAHRRAWAERWATSDVAVDGDPLAQRALRFAVYHLISAANPENEHVSVGARALTGEGYLGHVFWDTEIFLLPFYTFTWPEAARALLMYRYHTLPAARAKAGRLGYRGALYAWESADTGDEATPPWAIGPDGTRVPIRCGTYEQHVSADIAYAVWQYWLATGDMRFLRDAGAEIILETARFWADRAQLEADGAYHIRGVIGPDEYHEGVDDNAFTNCMARWNVARGLEVVTLLSERWPDRWAALSNQLTLADAELGHWRDVVDRLTTGFDAATGLYEQFSGFSQLDPVDLTTFEPRSAPMDVLLGPERTRRSQVIKQADVVMLLALLGRELTPEVCRRNFRHYEPRCAHGSSLSPATHALVAARIGDLALAQRYFVDAASIDLDDAMGNSALGVHIAALGGLWQVAVLGFGGLSTTGDVLRFDPHLPPGWQQLCFTVQWRGRTLRVQVQQETGSLVATLEQGRSLVISVGHTTHRVVRGEPTTCQYRPVDAGSAA